MDLQTQIENNPVIDNQASDLHWLNAARDLDDDLYSTLWRNSNRSEADELALTVNVPRDSSVDRLRRIQRESNHGAALDAMDVQAYSALVNVAFSGIIQNRALAEFPPRGLIRNELLKHLAGKLDTQRGESQTRSIPRPIGTVAKRLEPTDKTSSPSAPKESSLELRRRRLQLERDHGALLDSLGIEQYSAMVNVALSGILLNRALAEFPPKGLIRIEVLKHLAGESNSHATKCEKAIQPGPQRSDSERLEFLQRFAGCGIVAVLREMDCGQVSNQGKESVDVRHEIDIAMSRFVTPDDKPQSREVVTGEIGKAVTNLADQSCVITA